MSHPASADDGTDSDTSSYDGDGDGHDLDEGLRKVRDDVTAQLRRIDDHGERIKRVVGHAVVGDRADSDVATDLQQEIIEHIGEIHGSNDAVTVNEVAVALWAELYRVSGMVTGDDEEGADAAGTDGGEEATVEDDPETDPQGGLAFADGGGGAAAEDDAETDPAFQ